MARRPNFKFRIICFLQFHLFKLVMFPLCFLLEFPEIPILPEETKVQQQIPNYFKTTVSRFCWQSKSKIEAVFRNFKKKKKNSVYGPDCKRLRHIMSSLQETRTSDMNNYLVLYGPSILAIKLATWRKIELNTVRISINHQNHLTLSIKSNRIGIIPPDSSYLRNIFSWKSGDELKCKLTKDASTWHLYALMRKEAPADIKIKPQEIQNTSSAFKIRIDFILLRLDFSPHALHKYLFTISRSRLWSVKSN